MTTKFQCILADPPWSFKTYSDKGKEKSPEQHYQCMTLDDIKNMRVNEIAEKDSILFMWVTFPLLKEGIETMEAWGFKYKTIGFNWVKKNKPAKPGKAKKINPKNPNDLFYGLGYYTRANSEICLIGTKGKSIKVINRGVHQVILSPWEGHSKKPDVSREKIVELLGEDVTKVELFARQTCPGWISLGNEIDGKDIRDALGEIIAEQPPEPEKKKRVMKSKKTTEFPEFVRMGDPEKGTTLRNVGGVRYYRDAGIWEIFSEIKDGKLISLDMYGDMPHLSGHELHEITQDEYAKDNTGYYTKSKNRNKFEDHHMCEKSDEIPY